MNSYLTILVGISSVVLVYFFSVDNSDNSEFDSFKLSSDMAAKTAYVIGGSGVAGGGMIKALASHPQFSKVTIFGRRPVPMPSDDPKYAKFVQKTIDFENLSQHEQDFVGFDVGFCALGVTSGTPNYYKITHDYVADTAKLALQGGCKHFHLITGQGTNINSWFEWARIKAKLEQTVSAMGFERVSIYRPAGILFDNPALSVGRRVLNSIFKVADHWRLLSVFADVLGDVMVKNTFRETDKKVEILTNADINRLAKGMK